MWSIFVWCSESVTAPPIKGAKVVDSSASPRVAGAGYPFEFRTEILIDCYAPAQADTDAFLERLGAWLETLPGDWAVVTDEWAPLASRISGRLSVAPGLNALGLRSIAA